MIKNKGGFTLLELMIGLFILLIGIVGILSVYVYCYSLNETSRNITQAVNDGRSVFEAMRQETEITLWNVEYTDWESWAKGTASTISGRVNNTPLTSLSQEDIDVAIVEIGDPPLKISALQITVTISWAEIGGRQRSTSLMTLMTRR